MKIVNFIDVRFAQFRAFSTLVQIGCEDLGLDMVSFKRSDLEMASQAGPDDIILVPPYGAFIDTVRENNPRLHAKVFMIDLKGPMGIDSFLMLRDRLGPASCCYGTTMADDPDFANPLGALRSRGVNVCPLPFFPNPALFERIDLRALHHQTPSQEKRENVIFFAGAVWGYRAACMEKLRQEGIPVKLKQGLSPLEYFEELRRATIALDIRGGQMQTYRFHEIYLAGSCCLCDRRYIHHSGISPRDGFDIVFFQDKNDLVYKARLLLDDIARRRSIAASGADWYRKSHAPSALILDLFRHAGIFIPQTSFQGAAE